MHQGMKKAYTQYVQECGKNAYAQCVQERERAYIRRVCDASKSREKPLPHASS